MNESFDVAVIGGGITGAAALQHLTAAGYRCVLLEQGDFGGATSGRSSRLLHCGLTYFAPGLSLLSFLAKPGVARESLALARLAMRARSQFARTTPERLTRIEFLCPLPAGGGVPRWKARFGFKALEWLDRAGVPLETRLLTAAEAQGHPMLGQMRDPHHLMGTIGFVEYQFNWPERIVADALFNARDAGAELRNYRRVIEIGREGEGWRIGTVDEAGAVGSGGGEANGTETLRARAIVNAAGVWVDGVARLAAGAAPARNLKLNQGAKGVNVMVRLPPEFRGLGLETVMRDGKPFYLIPWDDLHYFGPKDRPQAAEPMATSSGFRALEDEIAALLAEMNNLFPRLKLTRRDVLYSWAGNRPRTARAGHPAGSMAVQLHDLTAQGLPDFFTFTGGLIMTHRWAGEDIAAAVGRKLRPSGDARPIDYRPRPLPQDHNRPAVGEHYPQVSVADLRHACEQEQVRHLDDLLFRRVRVGWSERLGADVAREAAQEVRDIMGWKAHEAHAEAERYLALIKNQFAPWTHAD